MELEKFTITNLFGTRTVDLSFEQNKLILVGENGAGKSTSLNALYYFLTRQWTKLAKISWDSVSATIDGTNLQLSRSDIAANTGHERAGKDVAVTPRGLMEMRRAMARLSERPTRYWREHPERLSEISAQYEVPITWVYHFLEREESAEKQLSENLKRVNDWFEENFKTQLLFLPTYRRIERDLQHIFKDLRIERETRSFYRRTAETNSYVELVEFGMRDVEELFTETMQSLDRRFRHDLNKLTGDYLRAVIRQEHTTVSAPPQHMSANLISTLLGRMDKILPDYERGELALLADAMTKGAVPPDKRVVAHFLTMLMEAHQAQQRREASVVKLVALCNSYFSPEKRLIFDAQQFELKLEIGPAAGRIAPRDLSSGEKQIVSLFTHLLLSAQRYFVLIDEPELSISVDWQRRLLSDIIESGFCEGLVAVTHSPFVFDNDLARFAHSMSEFVARNEP